MPVHYWGDVLRTCPWDYSWLDYMVCPALTVYSESPPCAVQLQSRPIRAQKTKQPRCNCSLEAETWEVNYWGIALRRGGVRELSKDVVWARPTIAWSHWEPRSMGYTTKLDSSQGKGAGLLCPCVSQSLAIGLRQGDGGGVLLFSGVRWLLFS